MQIKINAVNIELTDAIQSYVEEKIQGVGKFVRANEHEVPLAEIEIGKTSNHHRSGDIFRAEAILTLRGKTLRATAEKDDLYAAVDELREELVRSVTTREGKERTLFRKGAQKIKNLLRFGK